MIRLQQQQALNRGLLLPLKPSTAQIRPKSLAVHSGVPSGSCRAARLDASRPQLQRTTALWGERAPYDSDEYEYDWEDLAVGSTAAAAACTAAGVATGEAQPCGRLPCTAC